MVVVDRFTKYIIAIPTTGEISSMGTAKLLRDNVWKQFGIPWKVISDCGPQFAAQFMKDLHRLVGTKTNISTAYHPQTVSQTERMNQEIEQYLQMNDRPTGWTGYPWPPSRTTTRNRHQQGTHRSSSTTEDTQTRDSNLVTKSKARQPKTSSTNSPKPEQRHRPH